MTDGSSPESRQGYCPVFDIECPSGKEAAQSCDNRFTADYNPLTSFRDADIEHCAIYRQQSPEKYYPAHLNSDQNKDDENEERS